jgi:hypothetical protein
VKPWGRYQAELTECEAKLRAREEKARKRTPCGPQPKPPQPGPRDRDQYSFTDPDSHTMKNSNDDGFDQHDNAQIAADRHSLLVMAHALSNYANDQAEVERTLDALPDALGIPPAGALKTDYSCAVNITALEQRGIEPHIAAGRGPHHKHWLAYSAQALAPPLREASPCVKMAYKLHTEIGQAIYRLCKSPPSNL